MPSTEATTAIAMVAVLDRPFTGFGVGRGEEVLEEVADASARVASDEVLCVEEEDGEGCDDDCTAALEEVEDVAPPAPPTMPWIVVRPTVVGAV